MLEYIAAIVTCGLLVIRLQYLEFPIISDRKDIITVFTFIIRFGVHIQPFFGLKIYVNFRTKRGVVYCSMWIALSNPPKN